MQEIDDDRELLDRRALQGKEPLREDAKKRVEELRRAARNRRWEEDRIGNRGQEIVELGRKPNHAERIRRRVAHEVHPVVVVGEIRNGADSQKVGL
jgi:hypothetical protein